jgi:CHASE3 domain sensor protein
MRSTHKRFGVIAGFLILLLLLVLNTAVLRYQLAVQVGHQAWFSHSKRVVQALRDTESLLKDAETGQRGYLYTGKIEYLAPYRFASAEIDSRLHDLALAVGDNPREQAKSPVFAFWPIKSSLKSLRPSRSSRQGIQPGPKPW